VLPDHFKDFDLGKAKVSRSLTSAASSTTGMSRYCTVSGKSQSVPIP